MTTAAVKSVESELLAADTDTGLDQSVSKTATTVDEVICSNTADVGLEVASSSSVSGVNNKIQKHVDHTYAQACNCQYSVQVRSYRGWCKMFLEFFLVTYIYRVHVSTFFILV